LLCAALAGLALVTLTCQASAQATPTETLTLASATPVPTGDLGYRNVGGVVYDASQGPTAPIAGAAVTYTQLSFLHPGSGLATTGSDGHYAFQLYLHDTDSITFKASAAGFHVGSATFRGLDLWSRLEPIDFALDPEETATPTETPTPTSCGVSAPVVDPVTSPTDLMRQTITGEGGPLFDAGGSRIYVVGPAGRFWAIPFSKPFQATVDLVPGVNDLTVCQTSADCFTDLCTSLDRNGNPLEIIATTNIQLSESGWWDNSGMHDASNPFILAGDYGGKEYRSFYVFDLSNVTQRVVSAMLRLYNGYMSSPDPSETYTLFDVSTPIAALTASGMGQTQIFADLGSGITYGARALSPADNLRIVDIALNDTAIAALNYSLVREFAIGGAVTTLDHASEGEDERVSPGGGDSLTELILNVLPKCGNGTVDPGEECDDGNTNPFDGCTNVCTICGNGTVTAPEACDDGNLIDGDGCNSDCGVSIPNTPTPTSTSSTPTNTPTPTCAPTATPYCSDNCVPCPTIRPGCYASACGACIQNPTCASNEACVASYNPYINGCCSCATVTPTPTPTPTVLVYCTPPPCREGEVFYCPGECPGGCGTECATPTPTPTPTDTPTPCPTGTPPFCPVGQFVSCDSNPCNGCHCEPCTPCPPGEVFTGCAELVCPCTCAPAQGSVAAGFSVGVPNSTVDVPISLLLEPGVELATLEFTLSVSPDGFEPLLSPISFQPAAALPTPNVVTLAGNDTVRLRWVTGFTPPIGGGLDLGVLNVPLPYSQGWGSYGLYAVNVVDVSATSADGSPLPLRGLGATITRCTMMFFGLVTDAATGEGINGASVCLDSSSACVQTDPNGVYQELCYTGQSSAGTYLCATADGYQQACQGPWTPIGISLEADFSLAAVTTPTDTPTPTPTPTTVIVDHPTPTGIPPPAPTATFCPTGTPCPTGFATTPTPTATAIVASPCVGDCGNDGTVTIDEILTMVNIALGNADVSDCEADDANHSGTITVAEILTAVNNALNGCE
jgi:cysteine-rich repeat protein